MPVVEQNPLNSYAGNGVTTTFPYTFKIFGASDLKVTVDGVLQTLTTHYSVTGAGEPGGGNVVFVTAPDNATHNPVIIIYRDLAYKRDTDYAENGDMLASTFDNDLDSVVMMTQQLRSDLRRAIKMPKLETADQIIDSTPLDRANKVLGFDSGGAPKPKDVADLTSLIATVGTGLKRIGSDLQIDFPTLAKVGPNLRHLLFPSNYTDLISAGFEPYWFNQQWGGAPVLGGVDGDDTVDYATGYFEGPNNTGGLGHIAGAEKASQGFKMSRNDNLVVALVRAYKVGNPTDNLRLHLYPDDGSGTKPTGIVPTASAAVISGKTITSNTNGEVYAFVFSSPALTANTQYHLVMDRSGAIDASNYYVWLRVSSKKYPHGNMAYYNGSAWTATTTDAFIFAIKTANLLLQSGGQFSRKFAFFEGSPLNQSGALRTRNDHYFDESGFSLHQTFSSLTNSKTFFDASLGALDRDRVLLRVETNVVVLRVYETDGTVHTVTGTTNVTGAGPFNIGVSVRAKNDGADYVRLSVNGVSEGTPVTAASISLSRELRQQGHASIGGGFGAKPTWTHAIDFSQLPSHASNGWTFGGTGTEANAFSVSGAKLYQNKNGLAATENAFYTKSAAGLSNANGWVVQWKAQVLSNDDVPSHYDAEIEIYDGTKSVWIMMHSYYVETGSLATNSKYQIDNKSKPVSYLAVGKGSDFYLFADGKLIIDGTGLMTSATVNNMLRFGDAEPSSGANSDVIWSDMRYYSTAALLPEFTGGTLHEWACWSGDQAALFPLLYNSGQFIAAKELCGVKKNYIEEIKRELVLSGITSSPTTTNPSPVALNDLSGYFYGSRVKVEGQGTFFSSAVGDTVTVGVSIDGSYDVPKNASVINQATAGYAQSISYSLAEKLYCGLHRVEIMWERDGSGTATAFLKQRTMFVEAK